MRLSFEFRKDPSFRWGDIQLFVTVYDLELKILLFSKTKKKRNFKQQKTLPKIYLLQFIFNENDAKAVICHTQKTV